MRAAVCTQPKSRMTTCAILGSGPILPKLVPRLRAGLFDLQLVGLSNNKNFLLQAFGRIPIISPLRLRQANAVLREMSISKATFIGNVGSVSEFLQGSMGRPDSLMLQYCMKNGYFSPPHAFVSAIKRFLADRKIEVCSPIGFFPDLALLPGFFIGSNDEEGVKLNLMAAANEINRQPLFAVRQCYIVDSGRVIMRESWGTDNLIREFGKSPERTTTKSPTLVKIPVAEFQDIDCPVIGSSTVDLAKENGLAGIAVRAHSVMVLDQNIISTTRPSEFFIYAG